MLEWRTATDPLTFLPTFIYSTQERQLSLGPRMFELMNAATYEGAEPIDTEIVLTLLNCADDDGATAITGLNAWHRYLGQIRAWRRERI